MKKLFTLILCSFFLLGAFSCKKEKTCDDKYETLSEDQLSYWYFPEGSYWIYKAEGQELYDTLTLVKKTEEAKPFNIGSDETSDIHCGTKYQQILSSSFYGCSGDREQLATVVAHTHYKGISFSGFFDLGCTQAGSVSAQYENFLTDTLIGGAVYKDIIYGKNFDLNNEVFHYAFFSKNVGIIAFHSKDSYVWHLQSYHINQ